MHVHAWKSEWWWAKRYSNKRTSNTEVLMTGVAGMWVWGKLPKNRGNCCGSKWSIKSWMQSIQLAASASVWGYHCIVTPANPRGRSFKLKITAASSLFDTRCLLIRGHPSILLCVEKYFWADSRLLRVPWKMNLFDTYNVPNLWHMQLASPFQWNAHVKAVACFTLALVPRFLPSPKRQTE